MSGVSKGDLSNHASTAAAWGFVGASVLAVATRGASTTGDCRTAGLLLPVVFANLADEVAEGLINVDALLGRRFDELAPKVLSKVTALVHTNLSLVLEIALVSHNDDRERILVLDS